ncbi:hypothetical protein P8452_16169 [Trifolium repens]|nr:hypothetical protein P8452_16169 [Trifolium repens]
MGKIVPVFPELKEIERYLMEGERKPWLLYLSRKVVTTQTFCNMSDPTKSYSLDIPKGTLGLGVRLRPRTVQHGWYLLENKKSVFVSSFVLWNPLNLKTVF